MDNDDHHLIIGIDWKFVGRDYLAFFPDRYGELDFLRSEAFEQICDELANELPENCFPVLSSFLGGYGYELWNINTGGDDYALLIAASGEGEAACAACLPDLDEDGELEHYAFERLAPDALPIMPSRKSAQKTLPPIAVEDSWHSDYAGVWRDDLRFTVLAYHDDEGEPFTQLVDLETFPLEGIDAHGFFALTDGGHGLFPRHNAGNGQYWEWQKPQKRKIAYDQRMSGLAFITDYDAPHINEVDHSVRLDVDNLQWAGCRSALFQTVKLREQASWHDPETPFFGAMPQDAKRTAALLRIEGTECRHIANLHDDAFILPLSEHTVVVIENPQIQDDGGPNPARPVFHLVDCRSRQLLSHGYFPFEGYWSDGGIVALDADEIVYVRTTTAPHPDHSALREATGWLVRFNLKTGQWRQAMLDGLHDDYTTNMAVLRHARPDRYRVRSFEGSLCLERGHDDWLILNYITSSAGKHDLAWLWNSRDDQVVRITAQDFPRREVTIHWHKGKSRYVANDSCRLSLLPPFTDIAGRRPSSHLQWGEGDKCSAPQKSPDT